MYKIRQIQQAFEVPITEATSFSEDNINASTVRGVDTFSGSRLGLIYKIIFIRQERSK